MSDGPARIWDIVGKGRIKEGYDADLVLVDMEMERPVRNEEQLTKSGWSPWDGAVLQGVAGADVGGGADGVCGGAGDEANRSAANSSSITPGAGIGLLRVRPTPTLRQGCEPGVGPTVPTSG